MAHRRQERHGTDPGTGSVVVAVPGPDDGAPGPATTRDPGPAPVAEPPRLTGRQLVARWHEDWETHGRAWTRPGFQALACHRFGVWAAGCPPVVRPLAGLVSLVATTFVRNVYGVELPRSAAIGRRVFLPHATGIVVAARARVGDDCLIRQHVTLGAFDRGRRRRPPYTPRLGNGVQVGAGAVVVGGVTIGDGARIGPNAVVTTDVPAGGSAFAPPPRVIGPLRRPSG